MVASKTKQTVAAVGNLFAFGLFNTLVFKPLMEGEASFEAYKLLLISVIAFGLIFFGFAYFFKGSIGCYLVGLEIELRNNASWTNAFFKRYSYFIIFFLVNIAFFGSQFGLFFHIETSEESLVFRDLMYSQYSAGGLNKLLFGVMLLDYFSKIFNKDACSLRERWSQTFVVDRYKIKI